MLYALVGNQNCGKTTLFNRLTGSNQHVGNFPGVTVEKKEGVITGYNEDTLVDLPGIYSLSPYTAEEIVTRDFILNQKPDLLINIVDATAIERSLYLTMQLSYLNRPMVIALNMMDELSESGGEVDCQKLSQQLGIVVVPISALKGEGIKELLDIAQRQAKVQQVHCNPFLYSDVQKVWKKISQTVRSEADAIGWPAEFAALKLLEGDKMDALQLNPQKRQILKGEIQGLESTYGMDQEALMADMRYRQIEDICRETVIHPEKTKKQMRSDAIDRLLTHPVIGIPIFFCFLSLIFYITFGSAGMTMKNFLV
ncbi:MAG: ferrous iron transporter B [Clostridiales bacterium]|nr:ferrous iron transporter B [Clostridiales bacterium]